jgi:hypothetical protein
MLQTLTGNYWTHKTIVNYQQLQSDNPPYLNYKDIILVGIPANHMITGVKIVTLSSFTAGELSGVPNTVWVLVGNSNIMLTPVSDGNSLIAPALPSTSDMTKLYGMGNLTIPAGSGDSYESGSYRWFTTSAPGATTFSRFPVSGYSTFQGAYCLPQRFDAHDVIARFCICDTTDPPSRPQYETEWSFNANVTTGDAEITVQYTAI